MSDWTSKLPEAARDFIAGRRLSRQVQAIAEVKGLDGHGDYRIAELAAAPAPND